MTIPFTQGIAPFPAWTITLPAPLAFPREPFAAALAEHARLLQEHAERLTSLTRDLATSRDPHTPIVDLAAVIVARRDAPAEVRVDERGEIAFYISDYRGVLRPLLLRSEAPRLPIVVIARGAISLHIASIDPSVNGDHAQYRLDVSPDVLAVEPLVQEHRASGLGPLLVTRWVHPDREARYAWVAVPPEPESEDEAADRVLELYGPLAQKRLQAFLSENEGGSQPVVVIISVPEYGDGIFVIAGNELQPLGELFPAIVDAVAAHRERDYVPVLVFMGKKAATAPHAGLDRQEPPRIVESLRLTAEAGPVESGSSDDVPEARPPRRLSDGRRVRVAAGSVVQLSTSVLCFALRRAPDGNKLERRRLESPGRVRRHRCVGRRVPRSQ